MEFERLHKFISDRFKRRFYTSLVDGVKIIFWDSKKINGIPAGMNDEEFKDNSKVKAILHKLNVGDDLTYIVNHVLIYSNPTLLERFCVTAEHPLLIMRDKFSQFFTERDGYVVMRMSHSTDEIKTHVCKKIRKSKILTTITTQ